MTNLLEQNRNHILGVGELNLIGDRFKLAQWRQKGMGPSYYKLERKIIYHGAGLNTGAEAYRVHARAITFQLAEAAVTGPMLRAILGTIRRPPALPSCA